MRNLFNILDILFYKIIKILIHLLNINLLISWVIYLFLHLRDKLIEFVEKFNYFT